MSFSSIAISSLDTPKSLIPFFIKDAFDVAGRTYMADKESGKHEAREKFIEEAGTSLFWIGGIPAIRTIANKIVKNKMDTDIHFKRINSNGIQNYYADKLIGTIGENGLFSKEALNGIVLKGKNLESIQEKLSKLGFKPNESTGKYGKFHTRVTIAAVAINFFMLSYALPKFNQFLSRKIISKEVNTKKPNSLSMNEISFNFNNKLTFSEFLTKTQSKSDQKTEIRNKISDKNLSFGASPKDLVDIKSLFNFAKVAEEAQLNPTSSMLWLDYGISGSRVTYVPRDNNERIEYAIKEGGILLMFYYAADLIKKGLSAIANKTFNTPIDLDYRIITDKEFLKKLKTPHKKNELLNFAGEKADELSVIKFIDSELAKNPKDSKHPKNAIFENFTLKMAQKEGLIDIEFDEGLKSWIRHSKKYIETEKLIDLNKNLKTFYEKAFETNNKTISKTNIENIISKTKAVKAASVIGNIAICCLSLSYLLPKLQYLIREHRTKTCEAPGIKVYKDLALKKII